MNTARVQEAAEMRMELSESQKEQRSLFRDFVERHIAPYAAQWDQEARISDDVIHQLRSHGYLGAMLPAAGSAAMDPITYGLLTEEIGKGCSSVRSLLTVHDMVAFGIRRWGNFELKAKYCDPVARGHLLCALALSEPEVGSDAANVTTTAWLENDMYVLRGVKKWITFGQIADLYLVLAQYEGKPTAFLVPAAITGVHRAPLRGIVGTRASLLAEVAFNDCRVPKYCLVGRVGFGFSHVITSVLDQGRYSVAWGSVGIAQAALDACLDYTARRKQFGVELSRHQLVQRKLTNMIAGVRAARLLCYRAGYMRTIEDPGAMGETLVAKYFASKTAVQTANAAIQLHGANGLTDEYPVARYLRDAKVTEVIEGSTQIQQITIPKFPLPEL